MAHYLVWRSLISPPQFQGAAYPSSVSEKNAVLLPPLIVFHPTELCEQDGDIQSENASFAKNTFSNCVGNELAVAVAKQQVRHYHTC